MAANRFATLLHRNTNRFVLILVYTVLEWILIALLLLNSVFSYFITKYASFFGLPPPCIWCSRLERLLDGQTQGGFYRSLVCDAHAGEISKLGYCSDHGRLAEACGMCEGCSSSRPMRDGVERNIALFSLAGKREIDKGGDEIKCSCCGAVMDDGLYSPYLLIKPSWDVLDYTPMTKWIADKEGGYHYQGVDYKDLHSGHEAANREEANQNEEFIARKTDSLEEEEFEIIESAQVVEDVSHLSVEGGPAVKSCCNDDALVQPASEIQCLPVSDKILVPTELTDCVRVEDQCPSRQEADDRDDSCLEDQQVRKLEVEKKVQDSVAQMHTVEGRDGDDSVETSQVCELPSKVPENDLIEESEASTDVSHTVSEDESYMDQSDEDSETIEHIFTLLEGEGSEERPTSPHVHETISSILELVSQDNFRCEEFDGQESQGTQVTSLLASCAVWLVDSLVVDRGHPNEHADCAARPNEAKDEQKRELNDTIVGNAVVKPTTHVDAMEMHSVEEDSVPEMTTPLGSILTSNKELIFGRKEYSGPESLDGSILNNIEGDEILTIDRLRYALETEQRASNALYAELEEERSASAIAANQTMAMITRLQEEKSAMQMEALQYQRMMEEQSEYDQEALQLLNELMMKREKEKQELEKELELYRKKVLHYEAKERMRKQVASGRSRTSSASCSADDSDEISLDLNEGDENFLGPHDSAQDIPAGEVPIAALAGENGRPSTGLGESFAEFEEERLAILEQLKTLEDKLFALSDEEEERYEDVIPIKLLEDNTALLSGNAECFTPGDQNGVSNRFLNESIDETQNEIDVRRLIGSKAKRLLPLFDAAEMEDDGDGPFEELVPSVVSHSSSSKLASCEKKLAIEEEVDHVYERLHALEADGEFLKHSINSLKKGDKGMELLQEILQHLRDLRTVELRAKNTIDDSM